MLELVEGISNLQFDGLDSKAAELLTRIRPLLQPARLHRTEYSIAIAFGYAALERFLRDLLEATAHLVSDPIALYNDLPEDFRKHHLMLSLRAASSTVEHGTSRSPVDLLVALIQCLQGEEPFSVNGAVFAEHSANFRSELIRSSFRRLGLSLPDEIQSPALQSLIKEQFIGLYAKSSSVIDDLAERRNVVAHGDESELLSRSILRALVHFLEAFGHAICDEVFQGALKQLAPFVATRIGTIEHSWQNHDRVRAIGQMRPETATMTVGDTVVLTGARWRVATILSIQSNSIAIDSCGPSTETFGFNFGVLVHRGESVLVFPADVLSALTPYAAESHVLVPDAGHSSPA